MGYSLVPAIVLVTCRGQVSVHSLHLGEGPPVLAEPVLHPRGPIRHDRPQEPVHLESPHFHHMAEGHLSAAQKGVKVAIPLVQLPVSDHVLHGRVWKYHPG